MLVYLYIWWYGCIWWYIHGCIYMVYIWCIYGQILKMPEAVANLNIKMPEAVANLIIKMPEASRSLSTNVAGGFPQS